MQFVNPDYRISSLNTAYLYWIVLDNSLDLQPLCLAEILSPNQDHPRAALQS